jgi:hydroxyacylglutathione hydrolase
MNDMDNTAHNSVQTQVVHRLIAQLLWLAAATVLPVSWAAAEIDITPKVEWNRLRPLDSDPALDSGTPLQRACVPGETVVPRKAIGAGSSAQLALRQGQFVVCVNNTADGALEVVDGPGTRWTVARTDVNSTRGFPADWTAHDRDYLVWAYDRDTIIFRESLRGTFEGNFFYLLLDEHAALLIDTGTGYADLRPYVQPLLGQRKLYVVSTHNHSDHYGGHRHFLGMPNVEFAGYQPGERYDPYAASQLAGLTAFFKLQDWPNQSADFALGKRRLTIIPMPGHTADSIAIYDQGSQLLFSSDSIYPGLLFIEDWPHCVESIERLEQFAKRHPVRWLLGAHIEMSAARPWNGRYEYFHFGSNTHWNEHSLQLPVTSLAPVKTLLQTARNSAHGGKPRYDARLIEQDFHEVPFAPISLQGIARHYRDNNDRLVRELEARHARFDSVRAARLSP